MSELRLVLEPTGCCLCPPEDSCRGLRTHFEGEGGRCILRCTPPARLQGYPGILHGGFAAMFFDEVVGTAVGAGGAGAAVTRRLTIDYVKPIRVGEPLTLEGWYSEPVRGHLHRGQGLMYGQDGTVLATAEGEFAVMRGAVLERIFKLDGRSRGG